MEVYDVTNWSDTERNEHLSKHHMLGVKANHGKSVLHCAHVFGQTHVSLWDSDAARLPHVPARAVVRSGHRTTARAVKKN